MNGKQDNRKPPTWNEDWQEAADANRDKIFRRILGIEKEKVLEPVEELSLADDDELELADLTDADCKKETKKIDPKPNYHTGYFDFYDDQGI